MKDFPDTFPTLQNADKFVRKIFTAYFPPEPLETINEDLLLEALELEIAEFDKEIEK